MPKQEHEQWLGYDNQEGDVTEPVAATSAERSPKVRLEPRFNEERQSIEGFCPVIVEDPRDYLQYLNTSIFPLMDANHTATRIGTRAVVRHGITIPFQEGRYILHNESTIPLGGKWTGYDFVMNGTNMPGRRLSAVSVSKLFEIVSEAKRQHPYEPPKPLPDGFELDHLSMEGVSMEDLDDLVDLFSRQYSSNTVDLRTLADLHAWVRTADAFPTVIRNTEGRIVSVASGVMTVATLGSDVFRFFEITDTATHPDYEGRGLNRRIKHYLISIAAQFGADSIHTETRAALRAPNQSAARNGMSYHRTLALDKRSNGGPVDFDETEDAGLTVEAKGMSSSNVWAITPDSPLWSYYYNYREKKVQKAFA